MSSTTPTLPFAQIQRHIQTLLQRGQRQILGIVGPPGAGKSTLSLKLRALFPDISQIVPMDGFHLANVELQRLGRAGRKGAPDTFDADGYAALLQRLRHQRPDEIVYAPEFRREIEEPIAGAIPIFPDRPLLIAEGNYLLLDQGPWAPVAALLDQCWYVDVDPATRLERLVARHIQFGRTRQQALEWVQVTDDPNARVIEATRARSDFCVTPE